ncbi:MAG: glutathione peroxidase [Burkholderiales bacterium]|nr:glutathione peroxidase [Burkholderiales bacterium]
MIRVLGVFLFGLISLAAAPSASAASCPALLDQKLRTFDGRELNPCDYADRALLVVNTASRCGFTPQFGKLQSLYTRYKDKGLMVIGFPSNDFRQELATSKEAGEFCLANYGVTFPMMELSSVKGAAAHPLFRQLAKATGEEPGWNFHKYLIAPGGKSVYSFSTRTEPDSAAILGKLEPMLK